MNIPNNLSGSSPLVFWLNKLKDAVRSRTLLPGIGYRINQTPAGVTLVINESIGGTSTVTARLLSVVSVAGDYLTCTDGTNSYTVAKRAENRTSLLSETIDGVALTYSYSSSNARVVTSGSTTQDEVLYRRYVVGESILAVKPEGGTGVNTAPDWIEAQNRVWLRKYVQSS